MRRVPPGAAVLDPSLSRVQKQKSAQESNSRHSEEVLAGFRDGSRTNGRNRTRALTGGFEAES